MSKRDTLTLTRSGDFAFKTVGDKHCGPAKPGTLQECRYVVQVCCDPNTLDRNGYLFEQLVVQNYFNSIKAVKSTCELLAMRMAGELEDIIIAENPGITIYWIRVTLAAAPYAASMSFKYRPS